MIRHGLPVLYALFLWWFSTGVIFWLDGLPARTFRVSMTLATLLAAAALAALIPTGADTSIAGAYAGFAIGLAVWAWLELGYYTGFMVGPRRAADPDGSVGWLRFRHAVETTLYHEGAALALAAVIAAVSWDMPNRLALWTFLILWGMQLSAKLNVFLGVPNLGEGVLPPHLAFLRHYMTRKPMNLFFPVSVTLSAVLATALVAAAAGAADAFTAAGTAMLAGLVVLAVLEHWFLVVPVPVEALWAWALRARREVAPPAASPESTSRRLGRSFAGAELAHPVSSLAGRRPS